MARTRTISVTAGAAPHGAARGRRIFIGGLIALGFTGLVLARAEHPAIEKLNRHVMAVVTPVISFVSAPLEVMHNTISDWNALVSAHHTNAVLRAENDSLRHWQSVAVSLARENDRLRALARYKPVAQTSYIGAKVVGHAISAYGRGLLINAGAADGVKPYQPVIDAHGMVGRVVEVSEHASRLMLISDPSSRIPVTVGTKAVRSILGGTGDGSMQLLFVSPNHTMKVGDMVITSEDGGLLPSALAIGEVSRVSGRTVMVKASRSLPDIDYVRVVQFTAPNANAISRGLSRTHDSK